LRARQLDVIDDFDLVVVAVEHLLVEDVVGEADLPVRRLALVRFQARAGNGDPAAVIERGHVAPGHQQRPAAEAAPHQHMRHLGDASGFDGDEIGEAADGAALPPTMPVTS